MPNFTRQLASGWSAASATAIYRLTDRRTEVPAFDHVRGERAIAAGSESESAI
jgi:hypothetical protein